MIQAILTVPDISCEHCEHAIHQALDTVAGVHGVKVEIDTHLVVLDYDEAAVTIDQVKAILKEEEYPVEAVR